MPREITPRPATQPTPPTVQRQHIDRVLIEAGIDPGTLDIDPSKVLMSFDVVELAADGTIASRTRHTYALMEWPAQIRTDVVALRNHLLSAAESLGLIESGTDTGEIA